MDVARRGRRAVPVLLALACGLAAPSAHADVFVVDSTADGGAGSLRDAFTAAATSSGVADQIVFAPAMAGATVTLAAPLEDDLSGGGPLTINPLGDEVGGITLSGGGTNALLGLEGGDLTVNGMTLRDGRGRTAPTARRSPRLAAAPGAARSSSRTARRSS
jgi:hypothetical protein